MDIISANGGKLSKFIQNYTDIEFDQFVFNLINFQLEAADAYNRQWREIIQICPKLYR